MKKDAPDSVSGSFWDRQARLPGLRAVMDPNDVSSRKNTYLDCLHKTALARYGRFRRTDRVLDFGCGSGRIALWLAPRVRSVHGVDRNALMTRRAAAAAEQARFANVSAMPYDGQRLPFRTGSFSKVTSVWVVQHVLDDDEAVGVLREICRASRTEAEMFFLERVSDEPDESWLEPGVIRRRTLEEYERVFRRSGLTTVSRVPVWNSRPACRSDLVQRLVTGRSLPRWLLSLVAAVDLETRETRVLGDWTDFLFLCRKAPDRPSGAGTFC